MEIPEILGVEVITPDGRGSILSLHNGRVIIHLNKIEHKQIMKGENRPPGRLHYAYKYKVRILYCTNIFNLYAKKLSVHVICLNKSFSRKQHPAIPLL